jgi:quercetin 2,3-dioxygenase
VAGEALGVSAVIDTHTPIVFQDWTVHAGADVRTRVPEDHQALVYVFEGAVRVGDGGQELRDGQMAILGNGESLRLRGLDGAEKPGRLLLLAGVPLAEPVARYGPFVMNTQQEIIQAFRDYESGKMGEITRTARVR